jgi:hypothetical protein
MEEYVYIEENLFKYVCVCEFHCSSCFRLTNGINRITIFLIKLNAVILTPITKKLFIFTKYKYIG